MTLKDIALLLVGVWLILVGATAEVSDTLTLIFGIVVAALVLVEGLSIRSRV